MDSALHLPNAIRALYEVLVDVLRGMPDCICLTRYVRYMCSRI